MSAQDNVFDLVNEAFTYQQVVNAVAAMPEWEKHLFLSFMKHTTAQLEAGGEARQDVLQQLEGQMAETRSNGALDNGPNV